MDFFSTHRRGLLAAHLAVIILYQLPMLYLDVFLRVGFSAQRQNINVEHASPRQTINKAQEIRACTRAPGRWW